jgi:hypothetical protein
MPYNKRYIFLLITILVSCNVMTTDTESPRYKIYTSDFKLQYRIEDNKIYSGNYELLYRIENNKIYSKSYELLYRIENNKIYSRNYELLFQIENNKVYSGSFSNTIVYRIEEY